MSKTAKTGAGQTMSLPECANYLHLGEKTVLRLAVDNELPGQLVGRKWQFQRTEVDEWVQVRLNLSDSESLEEIPDGTRVPLGDVLPAEGVLGDLKSTDALGVIEELAAHAYNNKWLIDKPWFVGAVVERESLSSTAMEGGVAFLHTRAREASRLARPFVIVGRSYQGIDFGASDGKPTFLFFLLGLKYDRLHLPILGRLARTMLNPATISKLRAQPSASKMRALLLTEDARALKRNKQVPVHYEALKPKLDKQMRLRTIMRLNALRKHEARKAAEAERKAQVKEAKKKRTTAAPDKPKKTVHKKAATRAPSAEPAATQRPAKKKAASGDAATRKPRVARKKTEAATATPAPAATPTPAPAATKKTSAKKTSAKKTSATGKKTATKKAATKKPSTTSARAGGAKKTAAGKKKSAATTGKKRGGKTSPAS